ncbi:hypothetical protein V6N12_049025 [Hibiscus sabdariffa]|uniref:Uncharacterized protein n=1 Tax=Hibiscus sabdariffa TaxID=183260 RepID=A0ABR2EIZ2_9ROSI
MQSSLCPSTGVELCHIAKSKELNRSSGESENKGVKCALTMQNCIHFKHWCSLIEALLPLSALSHSSLWLRETGPIHQAFLTEATPAPRYDAWSASMIAFNHGFTKRLEDLSSSSSPSTFSSLLASAAAGSPPTALAVTVSGWNGCKFLSSYGYKAQSDPFP